MTRQAATRLGWLGVALVSAPFVHVILSQQPQPGGPPPLPPARVVRLDPALDAIVPPGAAIERFDAGYGFTEGPVWTRDGALLFSDVPGNTIFRVTSARQASIFRKPSGYDALDRRPGQHVGSNGLTVDRQGRLIIAEHGNRRVTRLESNGQLTVLADRHDGKRLNSPNDVVSPQGRPLGRIEAPEMPANVAWGDDGSTLYMTARTSIYRIRLNARGPRPCCLQFVDRHGHVVR